MPDNIMPGEFELIKNFLSPLSAKEPGAYLLSDDAAVISPRVGLETVITMDTLVSGVHFLAQTDPGDIASKAIRVNLSDLAAMGAEPAFYTLSLALPKNIGTISSPEIDEFWLERFSASLGIEQKIFGISIIGGDTVSTPGPLTLSITAIGYVEPGKAFRRSSASVGDLIVVSDTIGDAAFGLSLLMEELSGLSEPSKKILIERHNRPSPQVKLGLRLRDFATAAIDVSDGLIQDLGHICAASGVSAVVELNKVPVSDAVKEAFEKTTRSKIDVLSGGDDYQLLFTIPPSSEGGLKEVSAEIGVKLTIIGEIQQKKTNQADLRNCLLQSGGVTVVDDEGMPVELTKTGYRHF